MYGKCWQIQLQNTNTNTNTNTKPKTTLVLLELKMQTQGACFWKFEEFMFLNSCDRRHKLDQYKKYGIHMGADTLKSDL